MDLYKIKQESTLKSTQIFYIVSERAEHCINPIFGTVNEIASEPLSFLGGLKLKFELVPPSGINSVE